MTAGASEHAVPVPARVPLLAPWRGLNDSLPWTGVGATLAGNQFQPVARAGAYALARRDFRHAE